MRGNEGNEEHSVEKTLRRTTNTSRRRLPCVKRDHRANTRRLAVHTSRSAPRNSSGRRGGGGTGGTRDFSCSCARAAGCDCTSLKPRASPFSNRSTTGVSEAGRAPLSSQEATKKAGGAASSSTPCVCCGNAIPLRDLKAAVEAAWKITRSGTSLPSRTG